MVLFNHSIDRRDRAVGLGIADDSNRWCHGEIIVGTCHAGAWERFAVGIQCYSIGERCQELPGVV